MLKAAICYKFGKPLAVEEVEIDDPEKDEVLIRLAATAICHSDIHCIRGDVPNVLPLVAGHECSGYVEKVGENVTSVKSGDAVIASLIKSCGKCVLCKKGMPHLCEAQWPAESTRHLRTRKGQSLGCIINMSGFAEYMIVHESQVVKIPDGIKMDRAALLSCGVITGFGAVINRARVKPLSSVVVIGTGGVGLNSIQGAAFSGAKPVIAVDISSDKLNAAKNFGANLVINSADEDAVKAVYDITEGRGADYVFVTVGSINAIHQGISIAGKRGTVVIVGGSPENFSVSPFEIFSAEKTITGCNLGSTNLHAQIPQIISLYKSGKLKLDELITERFPLEKINDAIEMVVQGKALRNVIMFE